MKKIFSFLILILFISATSNIYAQERRFPYEEPNRDEGGIITFTDGSTLHFKNLRAIEGKYFDGTELTVKSGLKNHKFRFRHKKALRDVSFHKIKYLDIRAYDLEGKIPEGKPKIIVEFLFKDGGIYNLEMSELDALLDVTFVNAKSGEDKIIDRLPFVKEGKVYIKTIEFND